jgi:hypothetical protein
VRSITPTPKACTMPFRRFILDSVGRFRSFLTVAVWRRMELLVLAFNGVYAVDDDVVTWYAMDVPLDYLVW